MVVLGLGGGSAGRLCAAEAGHAVQATPALEGFVADGRWDEQATTLTLLDGVTVHINAPANLAARLGRPTLLVF
jgi:hypothetical protein